VLHGERDEDEGTAGLLVAFDGLLDLCCTFGANDGRADGASPDGGATFDPGPVRRSVPVVDADDFPDAPPAPSRTRRTDPLRVSGPDRAQLASLHVEHLPVFRG